jgi:hypothetical protein
MPQQREGYYLVIQLVAANTSVPLVDTEASMLEHLIDIISNFLKNKRCADYLFN